MLFSFKLFQIREFMQDLTCNHIIPYMEQKIRILNQQVCVCCTHHLEIELSIIFFAFLGVNHQERV